MKRIFLAAPLLVAGLSHTDETSTAVAAPSQPTAARVSQGQTPLPDDQRITLDSLLRPPSKATTGVTDLRTQLLTDAGKTVGFRGGMAARALVLRDALDSRADRLNSIFEFALLVRDGAIPPVIVEARDLASFSADQVRTATRVYKIEKEERFVSVPPTWRDYLFVGLPVKSDVELPVFSARPQDAKEEAIWRDAVKRGWEDGEQQAEAILTANINRLTRDYTGMLLYATLLQKGMISSTRIAESRQTVTGDAKHLTVGDTLRRVTSKAAFQTDPSQWRPSAKRGKQAAPKSAPAAQSPASSATDPSAPSVSSSRPQGDRGK